MPTGNQSDSSWLTCRVQYLDDTDPFSSSNFPEPTRPPSYSFNVNLPLCEQLAGVHRLLKAPHKVKSYELTTNYGVTREEFNETSKKYFDTR